MPTGHKEGVLLLCCATDVSVLPPTLHRTPPSPTASTSCEKSTLRNSTAGKGFPRAPLRAGCGGTPCHCHAPCQEDLVLGQPWGTGRACTRHGGGPGPGMVGVWDASSSPVRCGRLLKLGHTPSYVHSCFIISVEFQDGQEQARQGGQGRQQVTARSRCAQGAWKWGDGSRSCGL